MVWWWQRQRGGIDKYDDRSRWYAGDKGRDVAEQNMMTDPDGMEVR